MKKYSKEYAEKLADEITDSEEYYSIETEDAFIKGYMRAISENNVEELIEALRFVFDEIIKYKSEHHILGHLEKALYVAYQALKPHEDD